jgi:hypothetical protein
VCLSPSLSLSLSRGPDLSALVLSRAPALPLSAPPSPPVSSSLTSRPRSPRRGRAHVRTFSGHVRAPAPLLSPAPYSPTSPRPFTPSAILARPLSRSAHACREPHHRPPPVLRPPSRSRPVQCHGELRLTVSCSGHPLVCSFPPWFSRPALTGVILAQSELRHLHLSRPCATVVAPWLHHFPSRWENLPAPLISCALPCCSLDCSPEQSSTVVSPPLRVQRPPLLPRRCGALGWVRQITLKTPEPPPNLWSPTVASLLVSGELPPQDRAAPPRPNLPPCR